MASRSRVGRVAVALVLVTALVSSGQVSWAGVDDQGVGDTPPVEVDEPDPFAAELAPLDRLPVPGALEDGTSRFDAERSVLVDRAERSVTYANPDGTRTTRLFMSPVNWQDDSGEWLPIDARLERNESGAFENRSGPARFVLADAASGGGLVRLVDGDVEVTFGLEGATAKTAEVTDDTAVYSDVLPDVDLEYTVGSDHLKEVVVLKEPPQGREPTVFRFPVSAKGLVSRLAKDGTVEFVDADGEVRFSVPPGVAVDSSNDSGRTDLPAMADVLVVPVEEPGGTVLEVRVDDEWLRDPARVYPIKIDPTYYIGANSPNSRHDAFAAAIDPNTNYNGSNQWNGTNFLNRVGYGFGEMRTFYYYDLSPIMGKHVLDADYQILVLNGSSYPTSFKLHRITAGWFLPFVTWNNMPPVTGADEIVSSASQGLYWRTLDLKSWVTNWASGAWNYYGFRMRGYNNTLTNFASEENQTSMRPHLDVTYDNYPDDPTGLTPQDQSYVNDSTPELSAYFADGDGDAGHVEYELRDDATGTLITGSNGQGKAVASGARSRWTVPTTLSNGAKYKVRARAIDDDDNASGWSDWSYFWIDTDGPVAPGVTSTDYPSGQWSQAGGTSGTFTLTPGASTDVTGYFWSFDSDHPTNHVEAGSPTTVDLAPDAGFQELYVRSVDHAGNLSPATQYDFGVDIGGVSAPTDGSFTQKHLSLEAEAKPGVTGATFEFRRTDADSWQTIPAAKVKDSGGQPIGSWPVSVTSGVTGRLSWEAATTTGIDNEDGPIQVRAVLSGTPSGNTPAVATTLDQNAFGGFYATADVGPGSVNVVTGNLAVVAGDVSVASFGSDLSVARTFNSRDPDASADGPFGPGWQAATPVLAANAIYERLEIDGNVARVVGADDSVISFEELFGGIYIPQAGGQFLILVKDSATRYELSDLAGNMTAFEKPTGSSEWRPVEVTQAGDETATTYSYEVSGGVTRVTRMLAPTPSGVSCSPTLAAGCRALKFTYATSTTATGGDEGDWGNYDERLEKVELTAYDPSTSQMVTDVVASYLYDDDGRLRAAWDPRISPALKVRYSYDNDGHLATITPPGEEPWTFGYDTYGSDPNTGRLATVSRPTLPSGTATTTVVYGVDLDDPYDMEPGDVAEWGQTDLPTDATAIFPPNQVPADPPTSFERATVFYTNSDGRLVNTAAPGGHISTTEYNTDGNMIRSLSPSNRADALATGNTTAEHAVHAVSVDTQVEYAANGIEATDQWGPRHDVTKPDGTVVAARRHTETVYDEGSPGGWPYHLPTTVTVSAAPADGSAAFDARVTAYGYDNHGWDLRQPTTTTTDAAAGGLQLVSTTLFDPDTGQVTETRQPSEPSGGGAGSTKFVYYTSGTHPTDSQCGNEAHWANLLCAVKPAAQPGTSGLPDLPTTTHTYNRLNQPATTTETVGSDDRTTTLTYDAAGRPTIESITATIGQSLPDVTTSYDADTGRMTTTQTGTGGSAVTITRGYDSLGRMTSYTDADGNESEAVYDTLDRPTSIDDGKGTRTISYDEGTERRGLPGKLVDSQAGTFTATYDADGRLAAETLPNGLEATTTFNPDGQATDLEYVKTTNCSNDCTWLDFHIEPTIHGQWATHAGSLSSQTYDYDGAGRLTDVEDHATPLGCTLRDYIYDANSNRTALTQRDPDSYGDCDPQATGSTTTYTVDSADRLTTSGYTYDALGRTTALPAFDTNDPNGTAMSADYYVNDLPHTITRNSTTRTVDLDPARRYHTWTDSGGGETSTNHYSNDTDSPTWTENTTNGSEWTRNITGLSGTLSATADETDTAELQLANLHGDIVATASTDSQATGPTATFDANEFGQPRSQPSPRYGWHGANQRAVDDQSGMTLMGARLYNPTTSRFLQTDPIRRGSANAYEYGRGDPIVNRDLTGSFVVLGGRGGEWGAVQRDWLSGWSACGAIVYGICGEHRGTVFRTSYLVLKFSNSRIYGFKIEEKGSAYKQCAYWGLGPFGKRTNCKNKIANQGINKVWAFRVGGPGFLRRIPTNFFFFLLFNF
ncbi:MAG: DNRLRE domain-containing protein [Acidimicrobiia bacterium]